MFEIEFSCIHNKIPNNLSPNMKNVNITEKMFTDAWLRKLVKLIKIDKKKRN